MSRTPMIPVVLAAVALGCQSEAPPPAAPPAPQAAAANADQEVLIATVPDGADVLLAGAKVGATPFRMLVRGNTNIVLEKEGYVRQALLITPDSEPNLVVQLVADAAAAPSEEPEAEAEAETEPGAGGPAKAVAKKGDKGKTETEPPAAEPPGEAAGPEPPKAEPSAPAKAKAKAYETMAELKRDLRAGLITEADYRRWQQDIREKRAAELVALKQDYADGKLTKAEYAAKAREIKLKYEGN